ncbi:hypothetical protein ACLKA6_012954 [Drosophila palustris]
MEMSTPAPSEARDEQQATEATVATTVAGSSCGKYSDAQREVWYLATTPMAVRPSVCLSVCLSVLRCICQLASSEVTCHNLVAAFRVALLSRICRLGLSLGLSLSLSLSLGLGNSLGLLFIISS